jgi:hypothetical protein
MEVTLDPSSASSIKGRENTVPSVELQRASPLMHQLQLDDQSSASNG